MPTLTSGIWLLHVAAYIWLTGRVRMVNFMEVNGEENPGLFYSVLGLAGVAGVLSMLAHFFG
jgi:hypothetical protein